jgi:hypothetical protein
MIKNLTSKVMSTTRLHATGFYRDWRKLHNEELHNLHSSRYLVDKPSMRCVGHEAHVGEKMARKTAHVVVIILPGMSASSATHGRQCSDFLRAAAILPRILYFLFILFIYL